LVKRNRKARRMIPGLDITKELQVVKSTGKVLLGRKESLKAMLHGRAKLVVLAGNCPPSTSREIKIAAKIVNVRVLESDVSAADLGLACGRPFPAAVVAVMDPGSSSVLEEVSQTVG